jgi:putative ABC transport system permease protein
VAAAAFADLPLVRGAGADARSLAFTLAVTSALALAVGLLPAGVARRVDLGDVLRSGGRFGSTGRAAGRTRSALAAAEVAATVVLVAGAGLLAKSLVRLSEAQPGFDTRDLVFARVSLPPADYATPEAVARYADRVVAALDGRGGVGAAAVASALPLTGVNTRTDFRIAGRDPASRAETPGAQNRWVTPGYFAAMRIPVVAGRAFDERDRSGTAPVVVVDEALARRFFGGESAVGARLRLEDTADGPREVEVVGVVGSVAHFSLDDEPPPTLYAPLAQAPAQNLSFLVGTLSVVARTEIDPASVAGGFVKAVRSVDPRVPVTKATTMDATLARSLGARRMAALAAAGFAPVALALAVFGLYAVVAYAVSRRTREIAIRIALGAGPVRVAATVARPALAITAAGVAGGTAAALALARAAESLLYRVSPTDPWVFAGAAAATAAVALVAGCLPARRAARVDPMIAMRAE